MISAFDETVCAPATAVGTGAISIIRVSGPDALVVADRVLRLRNGSVQDAPGYSLKFGTVEDGGATLDEVLVAVFRAPHSYTGEDGVEIYCHASPFIVERTLQLLVSAGCRMAGPGEFTRRAFVHGRMDLAQAESVADLIGASSAAAQRVAMHQLKGDYSRELRVLRDELVRIVSLMELELDFSEEDVTFADRSRLETLLRESLRHIDALAGSFRTGNAIKNGVPVAIVGAVNSGKSTLLNALVGEQRAIVSDVPGTTRDTVEECVTLGGVLLRFIDTAGLRSRAGRIEKIGIARTYEKIDQALIVLCVLDATRPDEVLAHEAARVAERMDQLQQRLILLLNKSDEAPGRPVPSGLPAGPVLAISARTGAGLEALRSALADAAGLGFGADAGLGSSMVTNLRHYEALTRAGETLRRVLDGLAGGISTELLTQDRREAIRELGSIFGEITTDEILGSIFERFCIGK